MADNYHTLTRGPFEEVVFQFTDRDGQTHVVSQVISRIQGNLARISIKAPDTVKVFDIKPPDAEMIKLTRHEPNKEEQEGEKEEKGEKVQGRKQVDEDVCITQYGQYRLKVKKA